MNTSEQEVSWFLELVKKQMLRKATLYDGLNNVGTSGLDTISRYMFSVIEETGEVSSAITRHRYELAKAECIDVAHSALLLYLAIERSQ